MTTKDTFTNAMFIGSFPSHKGLPSDLGDEIAFCGRSNSGKSSVINALTNNKKLAKTSKTPGRTQSINLFCLKNNENKRLIDLPGYGYAKVSKSTRAEWGLIIDEYLNSRKSLKGLVVIMDIRHPFKDSDKILINWSKKTKTPLLVILNKADKLSKNQSRIELEKSKKLMKEISVDFEITAFSSKDLNGLNELHKSLGRLLLL
jgi:GTP-binding protein